MDLPPPPSPMANKEFDDNTEDFFDDDDNNNIPLPDPSTLQICTVDDSDNTADLVTNQKEYNATINKVLEWMRNGWTRNEIINALRLKPPSDIDNLEIIYNTSNGYGDELNISAFLKMLNDSDSKILVNEITFSNEITEILKEGDIQASMLYTWRQLSKAIPRSTNSSMEDASFQLFSSSIEIMEPYMNKLQQFQTFVKSAVVKFTKILARILNDKNVYVTRHLQLQTARLVNLFAVLDELVNSKTSILNDYTFYKRVKMNLHGSSSTGSLSVPDPHNLGIFLASKNRIFTDLKEKLLQLNNGYEPDAADHTKWKKIEKKGINKSFEDFFCNAIDECASLYNSKQYLLPSDKHLLIKFIGFGMHLIDSENVDATKLEKLKKLNINKIDKTFKSAEILPLYGDMVIIPFQYVTLTKHYDATKWPLSNSDERNVEGNILKRTQQVQNDLSSYLTKLKSVSSNKTYGLILEGLQLVSSWTTIVIEVFSWKLHKPADYSEEMNKTIRKEQEAVEKEFGKIDEITNVEIKATAILKMEQINDSVKRKFEETRIYEYATKHNYSVNEKVALITVIAAIKTLQKHLRECGTQYKHIINKHIFEATQKLVKEDLREPLRRSIKDGKDGVRNLIIFCRDNVCHWPPNYNPNKDAILSGKKQKIDFSDIQSENLSTPTCNQIHFLRTVLEFILDANPSGVFAKKMLTKEESQYFENFLSESVYWENLLDYDETLRKCCDLSQLWYREFFIEIAKGECVQFDTENSIPWILADFLLEYKNSELIDLVMFAFDLYNDSAYYSLNTFRKQFLYDEIEAEASLCFEQFTFKFSENLYSYYKEMAASLVLKSNFKSNIYKQFGKNFQINNRKRFLPLLFQNDIKLLGRSMNLRGRVADRMNVNFVNSLYNIIGYFESTSLANICEFETLLHINQLSHKLLSEHLPLTNFEQLLYEANFNTKTDTNRVTNKILVSITDDLPMYVYTSFTSRFLLSDIRAKAEEARLERLGEKRKEKKLSFRDSYGSKELTEAFKLIYTPLSNFIGREHIMVISRMLNYLEVTKLLNEMVKIITKTLEEDVALNIKSIKENLKAEDMKLPRYEYGHIGAFTKFQTSLSFMRTNDLSDLYDAFASIGNWLVFMLSLTECMFITENIKLGAARFFLNVIPAPYVEHAYKKSSDLYEKNSYYSSYKKALKDKQIELQMKYKRFHVYDMAKNLKSINDTQEKLASVNECLEKERLSSFLTIFPKLLERVRNNLLNSPAKDLWIGTKPANGVMHITDASEFYRIWSSLQFVFAIPPPSEHAQTIEHQYGDGILWAGCTLISLLGQQRRFEAMDISYHIEKLYEPNTNLGSKSKETGQSKQQHKFNQRIREIHRQNNEIFSIICKYSKLQTSMKSPITERFENDQDIHHFSPNDVQEDDIQTTEQLKNTTTTTTTTSIPQSEISNNDEVNQQDIKQTIITQV